MNIVLKNKIKNNQRFVVPGFQGIMGYAFSAASGASVFNKKINTICITGDGSLMTSIHDLSVISYNKHNVKIFIC